MANYIIEYTVTWDYEGKKSEIVHTTMEWETKRKASEKMIEEKIQSIQEDQCPIEPGDFDFICENVEVDRIIEAESKKVVYLDK